MSNKFIFLIIGRICRINKLFSGATETGLGIILENEPVRFITCFSSAVGEVVLQETKNNGKNKNRTIENLFFILFKAFLLLSK